MKIFSIKVLYSFLALFIIANISLLYVIYYNKEHVQALRQEINRIEEENSPPSFQFFRVKIKQWGTQEILDHASRRPKVYLIFSKNGCSNRFDRFANYLTVKHLSNKHIDVKFISTDIHTEQDQMAFGIRFPRAKELFYEEIDIQTSKKSQVKLPQILIVDRHFRVIDSYHIKPSPNPKEQMMWRKLDFLYDNFHYAEESMRELF